MTIEISKRLKIVAKQVKYRTIADIGTDHAYIPIYLCQTDKIDYAIASDINIKPLEKAKQNIKKYVLEDKISTVLGNGLTKVMPKKIETVIMSGMGGNLIIDILNNHPETVKHFKQILLQPQSEIYKVRKYIHNIGFSIENEEMFVDEKKYYTVINAILGNEKYDSEKYYIWGKILIERKDSVLKEYISLTMKKYSIIAKRIADNKSISALKRKEELLNQLKLLEEVFECL